MTHRAIQVGTGGRGETWARKHIQPFIEAGRVEMVAAVDVKEASLQNARDHFGLPDERCYTDVERALSERDADWCLIAVPPQFREGIVDAALDAGLDILAEKPIADTLEASVRIADAVERADAKMGVTMNHRFRRDVETFRRSLSDIGDLDRLNARLGICYSSYRTGDPEEAATRHATDHPLFRDCGIHHLDILAGFADAACERVYAEEWTPDWVVAGSGLQGHVSMRFENGVRAIFEGGLADGVDDPPSKWGNLYFRAVGRNGRVVLDEEGVNLRTPNEEDQSVALVDDQEFFAAQATAEKFLDWLDGGDPMETRVGQVLHSEAIIEAAIESSATGEPVSVPDLLEETRAQIR